MNSRYERIKLYDIILWNESSPIIIEKFALNKDNIKEKNVLQIKFKNISKEIIEAININIICKDINKVTTETVEYTYLDMHIGTKESFGDNIPIKLNDSNSRYFEFKINYIHFFKAKKIESNLILGEIKKPIDINSLKQYKEQFIIEVEKYNAYCKPIVKPLFDEKYWYCACGSFNVNESCCVGCGSEKEILLGLCDEKFLKEQQEIEEFTRKELVKQKRLEDEKNILNKKKRVKKTVICLCSIIFLLIVYLFGIKTLVSRYNYEKAIISAKKDDFDRVDEYVQLSRNTIVNINDYNKINQYYLENAKNYLLENDYDSANEFFDKIIGKHEYEEDIINIHLETLSYMFGNNTTYMDLYNMTQKSMYWNCVQEKMKENKELLYEAGIYLIKNDYYEKACDVFLKLRALEYKDSNYYYEISKEWELLSDNQISGSIIRAYDNLDNPQVSSKLEKGIKKAKNSKYKLIKKGVCYKYIFSTLNGDVERYVYIDNYQCCEGQTNSFYDVSEFVFYMYEDAVKFDYSYITDVINGVPEISLHKCEIVDAKNIPDVMKSKIENDMAK